MKKSVRLLALVVAIALMPMGAMTMPTASSAPCDDAQWWSPHSNSCQPLPCPDSSQFDAKDDVCQCNPGRRFDALTDTCQPGLVNVPPRSSGTEARKFGSQVPQLLVGLAMHLHARCRGGAGCLWQQ
jgi:hypothetical protein